jgi:hypothetical protein
MVPSATPAFNEGVVTIPNASAEGTNGNEPYPCLELIAQDATNPAKKGMACLNLQENCL